MAGGVGGDGGTGGYVHEEGEGERTDKVLEEVPDERSATLMGGDEGGVVQEPTDARDALVAPVGVLLPEVARAGPEGRRRLGGAGEAAGAPEVHERVVARGETTTDLGVERRKLGVHPVAAEPFAAVDQRRRVVAEGVVSQRQNGRLGSHHRSKES